MARVRRKRRKRSRPWLLPVLGVTIIGVVAALWTLLHTGADLPETPESNDGFAGAIRDLAARRNVASSWIREDDPIRKQGRLFLRTWRFSVPDHEVAAGLVADLVAEASSRGLEFEYLEAAAGELEGLRVDDAVEAFNLRFSIRDTPTTTKVIPTVPYERPAEMPTNVPKLESGGGGPGRLAILLDDAGQNMDLVKSAADLPEEIGFAVLPFLPSSSKTAKTLHREGHEIWLHMPMEPTGYPDENPGPGAVFLEMPEEEIRETVHRAVNDIPHVVGVNNHMGSRVTSDLRTMTWVMQEIKARGLAFIDSRTTVDTVAEDAARAQGVPAGRRHVFLDNERTPTAIRAQLEQAVIRVLAGEDVVAIGHFAPVTVEVLAEAGPTLKDRGVILVSPRIILN